MDAAEKFDAIINCILPYINLFLTGRSNVEDVALQELDKDLRGESWELARNLWELLDRAGFKADPQLERTEFVSQLTEFLENHTWLADELLLLVGGKTVKEKRAIHVGDYAIAVGGHAINSNIIYGSNNIISVIERAASTIEMTAQADKFEQNQLRDSLIGYVNTIKSQTEMPKWGDFRSPYKALLEYEISDSALFFGRDKYIAELLDCIQRSSLTILHSESGAGKSSLLRAGIGSRLLIQGLLPLYVRPRDQPALQTTIKQSLALNLEQSPNLAKATLQGFLHRASRLLEGEWLVIIIDQFEEIFTLQSEADRKSFINQLAMCLDDKSLPVRWILSLRSEWFGQLAKFQPLIRKPFENSVFLDTFSWEDAYQVIVQPAKTRGVIYEDGLAYRIVRDLAIHNENPESTLQSRGRGPTPTRGKISPPQLQLVCSALFNNEVFLSPSSVITAKTYESLGKAKIILQDHLDRVIDKNFPVTQKDLAKKIMTALVDDQRHRVLRSLSQLRFEIRDPYLEATLKQLVNSHLVRIENEDQYELAHDYLAEKISLDPEMQKQKFARDLLEQGTRKYEREGIKLSADELRFLKPFLQRMRLTSAQQSLIEASKKDETRRRYLSLLGFMATFSVGASIIIIMVILLLRGFSSFAPEAYVSMLLGSVLIFGMIGSSRGWARELLLSFGLILSLAINRLILLVPYLADLPHSDPTIFWIRLAITVALAYLGYQTVATIPVLASKTSRERFQDAIFGAIMGALNGYLLIGSIWYYLHALGYTPLGFLPPTSFAESIAINYLPPVLLGGVGLVVAVILMLIFFVVVYI